MPETFVCKHTRYNGGKHYGVTSCNHGFGVGNEIFATFHKFRKFAVGVGKFVKGSFRFGKLFLHVFFTLCKSHTVSDAACLKVVGDVGAFGRVKVVQRVSVNVLRNFECAKFGLYSFRCRLNQLQFFGKRHVFDAPVFKDDFFVFVYFVQFYNGIIVNIGVGMCVAVQIVQFRLYVVHVAGGGVVPHAAVKNTNKRFLFGHFFGFVQLSVLKTNICGKSVFHTYVGVVAFFEVVHCFSPFCKIGKLY